MKQVKKVLVTILCAALIASLALFAAGCSRSDSPEQTTAPQQTTAPEQSTAPEQPTASGLTDGQSIGEGATQFTLTIVDPDKQELTVQVNTDKETVGEALVSLGLAAGNSGEFGLMITSVNGISLDFQKDGMYWAFYVNGEYATKGVDQTEIVPGTTYMLKAE